MIIRNPGNNNISDKIKKSGIRFGIIGVASNQYIIVWEADFSGENTLDTQFTSWNDRAYGDSIYEDVNNTTYAYCADNKLYIKAIYSEGDSKWHQGIRTTQGRFETDHGKIEWYAKYSSLAYAWNCIITYGTGLRWTSGLYADGLRWPSPGEIDTFEQIGGGGDPTKINSSFHYGSGTNSGYPDTHLASVGVTTTFDPTVFHKFKVIIENGIYKCYIDDALIATLDGRTYKVTNAYLIDYYPFLHPQAWYLHTGADYVHADTANTYEFICDYMRYYDSALKNPASISCSCDTVDVSSGTLTIPVDASVYIQSNISPSTANNKAIEWESSNESIATVVAGYITAIAEGSCTITMNSVQGNATATLNVVVSNSATISCVKVAFAFDSAYTTETSVDEGDTKAVTFLKWPTFTNQTVTYESSDDGIATYDGTTLTGVSDGTCTITATCGTKSEILNVTVNDVTIDPVIDYTFNPVSVQSGVVVTNAGSAGTDYNITVNYAKPNVSLSDIAVTTPTALTIPTREAGNPYLILFDVYDPSDRHIQSLIQSTGGARFTTLEGAGDQPLMNTTFANIETGGDYQQASNGSASVTLCETPGRIAMWRNSSGCFIYYTGASEAIAQTTTSYIKDLTKIKLTLMRCTRLKMYYYDFTNAEVIAMVDA